MSHSDNTISWTTLPTGNGWTEVVWTRDRPPYLNDDNVPSSQVHALSHPAGEEQNAVDDTMELDLEAMTLNSGGPEDNNYAPSSGTSNSGSTITAYTAETRSHYLQYYIHSNPLDANEQHTLTVDALEALNHGNTNHGYLINLPTWRRDGYMFGVGDTQMTDSMVMAKHPKSNATQVTLSSAWSIIPDVSHQDRSGENVNGVGGLFDEVVAAPLILDEDDFYNV